MISDGSYGWIAGVLVVTLAVALCPATARGSCAGCHKNLYQDPDWAHSYTEWRGSMHADQDVTCIDCHGGDGETVNAAEAHASMWLPDGGDADGRSAVEADCGGCHTEESAASLAGPHDRALDGDPPDALCTDCHGPVGDHVPTADDLAVTCRPCHASGHERVMVWSFERLLDELGRLRVAVAFPSAIRLSADQDRQRRAHAAKAIRAAMVAWHRLDLGEIGRTVAEAAEAAEAIEPGLDP